MSTVTEGLGDRLGRMEYQELRKVAKALGLPALAARKKGEIVSGVMDVACGRVEAGPGAFTDTYGCDEGLIREIEECRRSAARGETEAEAPAAPHGDVYVPGDALAAAYSTPSAEDGADAPAGHDAGYGGTSGAGREAAARPTYMYLGRDPGSSGEPAREPGAGDARYERGRGERGGTDQARQGRGEFGRNDRNGRGERGRNDYGRNESRGDRSDYGARGDYGRNEARGDRARGDSGRGEYGSGRGDYGRNDYGRNDYARSEPRGDRGDYAARGDYVRGEGQAEGSEFEEETYSGILEKAGDFWFIRTNNCQITSSEDVFVPATLATRCKLREGDEIECRARRRRAGECPGATYILSVNGLSLDQLFPRKSFDRLTPCYPDKRYTLEYEGCSLTERVIDMFSPIGNGQRALIVSPPKAGKTTMLKTIACAVIRNHPDARVIILLTDERPEEVTDIERSVKPMGAEVYYSTFDKGETHHIQISKLVLEHAKRLVEIGKDVVLLMDSLTRLTRAYNSMNNSGKMLSGGLDPQALVEPRKFFGAARNVEEGGSLTIIATALIDTGSRLDNVIYEEFKSAGNMEIVLSRDLAERRIFPAIDIKASGARKEELLLSEEEAAAAGKVRAMLGKDVTDETLFLMMKKAPNNAAFCERLDDWVKIYKGSSTRY